MTAWDQAIQLTMEMQRAQMHSMQRNTGRSDFGFCWRRGDCQRLENFCSVREGNG